MKGQKRLKLKMRGGDSRLNANEPTVMLVPGGKQAYLWVGNDADGDKACYAHVSGQARLRKLALAILAEVGG